MSINNFKIIALEVLDDCGKKHYKLLIPNQIYYFYTDYKIEGNNVKFPKKDLDLYSVSKYSDNNLRISISALVGKNGSGKSTIIELLIKAINNLAYAIKEQNKSILHKIELVEDLKLNLYYQIGDTMFKLNIDNNIYKIYNYNENKGFVEVKDFKLEESFYTEVINYSLYAYNSYIDGNWINNIFHKNDGYQT
ncbi:MAG: ATP-binding cassette domain-containing protein, partial [Porphyromonadaceae bacterium]|nr:ATP-binding cassette domain-containing protein [Porphyromonadaceae bacterium]